MSIKLKMRSALLLLMVATCWTKARSANNCTACDKRTCPLSTFPCPGHRATDPCGCCEHCAKQKWEPCGGADWELGYCDRHLQCANVIGIDLVEISSIGVCKEFPGSERKDYNEHEDMNCPKHVNCKWITWACNCSEKHTCILDSRPSCHPKYFHSEHDYEAEIQYRRARRGCDIVDGRCVCESQASEEESQFNDVNDCYESLDSALYGDMCKMKQPEKNTPRGPLWSQLNYAQTFDYLETSTHSSVQKDNIRSQGHLLV